MLWPLLLVLLPARLLVPVCLILIAINVALVSGVFGRGETYVGLLHIALPSATYAPIILGSLAAILLHWKRSFAVLYSLAGGTLAALLGFVGLAVLLHVTPGDVRGLPNLAIHSAMTFCVMALVLREDNLLSPFFKQRLVARIGVVSYGIYLYHLIALNIAHRILPVEMLPKWAIFIVFVILSYLIAEASFRTLEAFFQRFRPRGKAR